MRRLVLASIALACTPQLPEARDEAVAAPPAPPAASPPAPPAASPATPQPAQPATPQPAQPATPQPATPPSGPLPLQAGPGRWQLPDGVRCDDMEPGPFCGVHVVELAERRVTTLVRRGEAWHVREGRDERPTQVEFVFVLRPDDQLARGSSWFASGPDAHVSLASANPLVPEAFVLPGVRDLHGDFAVRRDRLYAVGSLDDRTLVEVDPREKTWRAVKLPGKTLEAVFPAGEQLALYLTGKRTRSVGLLDAAADKLAVEVELPRDLAGECRRKHHDYAEDDAVYVPSAGRFYVGFSCYPDA